VYSECGVQCVVVLNSDIGHLVCSECTVCIVRVVYCVYSECGVQYAMVRMRLLFTVPFQNELDLTWRF
jgi:hypothetical protein